MADEEIFDFLIDDASVASVAELLLPDADVIRLYNHYPEPAIIWWEASVPLTSGGPNRNVTVQAMAYDVEMSRLTFLEAADELERKHGGLTLVQSYKPLPADIHPRNFHKEDTLLKVLAQCGACLFVELPHANETAGLTIFGRKHLDWLVDNEKLEVDGLPSNFLENR